MKLNKPVNIIQLKVKGLGPLYKVGVDFAEDGKHSESCILCQAKEGLKKLVEIIASEEYQCILCGEKGFKGDKLLCGDISGFSKIKICIKCFLSYKV